MKELARLLYLWVQQMYYSISGISFLGKSEEFVFLNVLIKHAWILLLHCIVLIKGMMDAHCNTIVLCIMYSIIYIIWHCCRFHLSPIVSSSTSLSSTLIPLVSLFTAFAFSAGDLSQVPSRSDLYSGSLPLWHEEGASVGSHRHDGAVRPLGAGGQKAQNQQEENPRYDSTDTQRGHFANTHTRKALFLISLQSKYAPASLIRFFPP